MKTTFRLWLSLSCLGLVAVPATRAQTGPDLAARARDVLRKHCFDCHGKNPKKLSAKLNLFDPAHLADKERKIVVPKAPDESELVKQVEQELMPPGTRAKVPDEERKLLREWIAAGAAPFPAAGGPAPPAQAEKVSLASQVKEIFRTRCLECHGDTNPSVGVKILDRDLLVKSKKKVLPGKAEDSMLYQVLIATDATVMPKGQPRLPDEEIDAVKRWIDSGAPDFPPNARVPEEPEREKAFQKVVGVDHVLKSILADVRKAELEDRRFLRYFSFNHILTAGATPEELGLQHDALAKAINHLTWEDKPVKLRPIDSANTVFAIDLRQLGWQQRLYRRVLRQDGKDVLARESHGTNLFDLVLLEYPYAIVYEDSDTFDRLAEEYLSPAGLVQPIPYVRADWFVSTVTQPPLYEDMLQLPFEVKDLEQRLGVNVEANLQSNLARRAGMTLSGVSRNNRVVERHPLPRHRGAYWKSFDFRTSKGTENMFKDPIDLHPTGGEFIFTLPNGLQGYLLADARGNRLEAAPTEIVTDKFAADKTVRNGLACMRCHEDGMKDFKDSVRPALQQSKAKLAFKQAALQLYPSDTEMGEFLKEDTDRFLAAMKKVLGKAQATEPLFRVSRRFLDAPLQLGTATGELGLAKSDGLEFVFKMPEFSALGLVPLAAQGVVRRDAWEDYYDQVVRGLGLGTPVAPLDGSGRRDFPAGSPPFEVELKTNHANNLFKPDDRAFFFIVNKGTRPLFVELVLTGIRGEKSIPNLGSTVVQPGQTLKFPSDNQGIKVQPRLGKEQLTLFASETAFPAGELLRGEGVTDRVIHRFLGYEPQEGRVKVTGLKTRIVKKTIDIETR